MLAVRTVSPHYELVQLSACIAGDGSAICTHRSSRSRRRQKPICTDESSVLFLLVAYTAKLALQLFLLRHLSELLTPPFHPFVERADARFVEASLHPSARDSETAHQNGRALHL